MQGQGARAPSKPPTSDSTCIRGVRRQTTLWETSDTATIISRMGHQLSWAELIWVDLGVLGWVHYPGTSLPAVTRQPSTPLLLHMPQLLHLNSRLPTSQPQQFLIPAHLVYH